MGKKRHLSGADLAEQLVSEKQRRTRAENINRALFSIARAVNNATSLQNLYADIHQALGRVIDLTNFFIGILDKEANMILLPYYVDEKDKEIDHIPNYTESSSLSSIVVRTRKPVFMTEEEIWERAAQNGVVGTPPLIWVGIPLMIDNEVIGIMATQSYDDPCHYDRRDIDILVSVSEMVAMAIQRKRAEVAIMDSERRFRTLHEASFGGIGIHDKGLILDANEGLARMTGYRHSELVGMNGLDLIAPPWRETAMNNILSDFEKPYDAEGLRKDGTTFPMEIRGKKIPYMGREVRVTEFRDITERKHVEEALRRSEEKYRTILENMVDAYFEVDLTGRFTFFNDAICHHMGYSREELLGMDNRVIMDEKNARIVFDAFHEAYLTRKPGRLLDLEVIRKDGSSGWAEIVVSPIIDEMDQVVGFRGVGRNITQKKAAEKERQHLEAELRQSQRLESLGKLAGGIAHDFNNLLMGIQGQASLMMLGMEPGSTHYRQLESIENLIENAAGLTRQLLGLARGGKYEVKSLNLNPLLQQGVELFGRTRRELLIRMDLEPDLWTVSGDRSQLDQVLLNLFVNAWQAMPSGGELTVRSRNQLLSAVDTRPYELPAGRYVRISVADTGTGIDETIKERIFDPFFTTKDKSSGIGLGLASVYGIIKNHEGFIRVESGIGRGTTFHFFLPAVEKVAAHAPHRKKVHLKGSGTILLVDDEEMILDVGKGILNHLGFAVMTASSGAEAVERFRQASPPVDLVIIDMIMPGMNGGELFDAIRAITPGVPVLLSSGYSIDGQASAIMARGCNGFIQKPFTISQLSLKIREVMNSASAPSPARHREPGRDEDRE